MEFAKVKISDILPAEYNPRKELKPDDEEFIKISNSIDEFGYSEPIIVNKDMTIIGGHQRLNVLKYKGVEEIEVVMLDLPKDKEKALNIALNKITGYWDMDKLTDLLLDLGSDGYDLELTGFDMDEIGNLFSEPEEKENARMNTVNHYNLQIYNETGTDGFYQMPVIQNDGFIPSDLIGFNYAMTSKNKNVGIHCFVDDYQFERLWNRPDEYVDMLSEYECVLSPDFSLYMNMPMAMKIWNVYRSRLLGQYWQSKGIKVIPTISWAEKETFEFCFDGIPEKSIVAISTIGVKREDEAFTVWKDGVDAMIQKIKPETILVYGGQVEYDYGENIKVIYFDNKVTERLKKNAKK